MSEPLKIAFVVEGPTDFAILMETIKRFLGGRDYIPTLLQPEISEAFKVTPGEGGGWPGVYRWCAQAVKQAGCRLSDNLLFDYHDLLVLQIDADVASFSYSEGDIREPDHNVKIPCEKECPPASATVNKLREVILCWMNETIIPDRVVLCVPSKALEAWLLAGLFPEDSKKLKECLECRKKPETLLQSKPMKKRLVRNGKKDINAYRNFAPEFADNWKTVKEKCGEATRFENEFRGALQKL